MDQASASLVASCARNLAVPKTSPSWRLSEDQSQIVVPPRDGLAPQFEPHSEPVHIAPRPSSPALCQSNAKGYLLPDFYSGHATRIPGRFSEGLLLRRVQLPHRGEECRPEAQIQSGSQGSVTGMPSSALDREAIEAEIDRVRSLRLVELRTLWRAP